MALKNAMFLFEVLMQDMKAMIDSRQLVVKADFADIFSLELKDPKRTSITMPKPNPLPPEPVGRKGKKKPKPKKKRKKGAVELPPSDPEIKVGQSILFSSSAEVLKQTMEKKPVEYSLWSKENGLKFIGSTKIQWHPIFLEYLQKILDCTEPPPIAVKDRYNIFQKGKGKLVAQITIQITLRNLTEMVTTSFRTLTEEDDIKKVLYREILNHSKLTSLMSTYKTTDNVFEENHNNICYTVDKVAPKTAKTPIIANSKNAPGANLSSSDEKNENKNEMKKNETMKEELCCAGIVDKVPDSKYTPPETYPSIDFIIDYVRQIIASCNDNMRMLTPQPTIKPRIEATDIDKLCYSKETNGPEGEFAQRSKDAVQTEPCPLCIDTLKKHTDKRGGDFDIANLRGPCGRSDCRIAQDIKAYIEKLIQEGKVEFNLEEMVGPYGSKECTVAEKILQFLRNQGVFNGGTNTKGGLSTQCDCIIKMQKAIKNTELCVKDCSNGNDTSNYESQICPVNAYNVYYFTVELDDAKQTGTPSATSQTAKSCCSNSSSEVYRYCDPKCPTALEHKPICSKTSCLFKPFQKRDSTKCIHPICPSNLNDSNSPADSNVELDFDDIVNPCCVQSCDMAEKIKDIIVDGQQKKKLAEDSCYCDCVCDVHFDNTTTYCAVCGGYESLGTDMKDMPEFMKPHPCPVYHKLYDRKYIKTVSPWPEENVLPPEVKKDEKGPKRGIKSPSVEAGKAMEKDADAVSTKENKAGNKEVEKKVKKAKEPDKTAPKSAGSATAEKTLAKQSSDIVPAPPPYPYPPVPKNMGWMWKATDIPGMKPHHNQWRPGAVLKRLVRKYRMVREGVDVAKKKRALMNKKKKIEMKPTLVVTKHQYGEYTVQLEVFKKYSKERLLHQYPYEEKPPMVYLVGKTDEEREEFKKQQDRKERRETRRKCRLLQSAFRDKCQEICLKAYNQAIGILPLPNPNDPNCPCASSAPNITPPIESCSCSDAGTISSSDSDNDEWTIEFTPPMARWDPKAKHPPTYAEAETQYTYLDYRVKLLDRHGNQVPRFFKGPDGKQLCSDLGGFWYKDQDGNKEWLEINKDGFIGPDARWIPQTFIGPDGMTYTADEGSFTDNQGRKLKIGVDGYIGPDTKWIWYGGRKIDVKTKSNTSTGARRDMGKGDAKGKPDARAAKTALKKTDETKDAPKSRSPPKVKIGGNQKGNNPLVMNVAVNYNRNLMRRISPIKNNYYANKPKVDDAKLDVYREIMEGLEPYRDVLGTLAPMKTNRASNTQSGKELYNSRYTGYAAISPSASRFSPCSLDVSRRSSGYRSPMTFSRRPMSTAM